MGERVYNKLAEAQALAEAEDYVNAQILLDEVRGMKNLSPYETAQLYNFYGYIYYIKEDYRQSITAYETVLRQPDLPQGLRDQTLYTLAQLNFTIEDWSRAVDLLTQWLRDANNPGPEPYILLGSAFYQLERYRDMIEPIRSAMDVARARNQQVREQWWLLLRVAYFELEDYEQVRDILEILVVNWPKKEYWTQLSAMYGELDDEDRQLSAYVAAYDQGLLTRSNELVQLSQLYLQADAPYLGARVLDRGINDGSVEKNAHARNWRLLSQAWALAAEDAKAVPALKTAAGMSDDGELDLRLAQSYLNLSQYDECSDSARDAIRKGGLRREDTANVVLGMCLFELDRLGPAKAAFRAAARDSRSRSTARRWLSYIEKEEERKQQLEESLRSLERRT